MLLTDGAAAAGSAQAGAAGGLGLSYIISIVAMIAIFYFLLLRPQKKEQKRMQEMRAKARTHMHKVQSGETLSSIARKFGTTIDNLCRLNNIKRTTILRPGQILRYS